MDSRSHRHGIQKDDVEAAANYGGVGSPAPDFAILTVSEQGQRLQQLSDFRGGWLALMFYPRDFSFVCPTELTAFSSQSAEFRSRNCELLAISIDSLETHERWLSTPIQEGGVVGLQFPLGADPNGCVCRSYGIWRVSDELPNRGLFLIDPSGIVRFAVVHDLGVGRHTDHVLHVLDALQTNGMCPGNWTTATGALDIEAMLTRDRVLGHYKIIRELGRGTFGYVLEAYDLRLQRQVALKVIHKRTAESEASLLAEARSVAAVQHPNICTIFAVDRYDGLSTIVMEYLEGLQLSEMIAAGVEIKEFPSIARQLSLGLSAAHAQGVVHADLKPANIIFRTPDCPVIVDFGLAPAQLPRDPRHAEQWKALESVTGISTVAAGSEEARMTDALPALVATPEDVEATVDFSIELPLDGDTPGGASEGIAGTPIYMSPEQAVGEPVRPPSDIFSLGMIFLEMLTGRNPLREMSLLEVLIALPQPEFLESLHSSIPLEFQRLIRPMLALDPWQRPTAQQIVQSLSE